MKQPSETVLADAIRFMAAIARPRKPRLKKLGGSVIRRQSHFYLSRYYIISSKVERVNDISIFRIFPPPTRFNRVYIIRKKSRSWRRISSEGPPLSPRYRYLFTKQRNLKRGGILYTSHRQTFRPREGSLLPSYGGGGWVTRVRGFEEVSGREKGDVFSGQQQISYD